MDRPHTNDWRSSRNLVCSRHQMNILLYVLPVDTPSHAEHVLAWILRISLSRDSAIVEPSYRFGFSKLPDDGLPGDPLARVFLILLAGVLCSERRRRTRRSPRRSRSTSIRSGCSTSRAQGRRSYDGSRAGPSKLHSQLTGAVAAIWSVYD
jgi:hypothetical protein